VAELLAERVRRLMPRARQELAELVAFRSVADASQFPQSECERAVEWLVGELRELGLQDVQPHATPDGSKAVVARRPPKDGAPTVLLYAHYDVQPPLGEEEWVTPVWELTERDGRWYGRGTADCKGNIVAHLLALRVLDDDAPVGVKVVLEGSEEQGTGGLERLARAQPDLLRADAIVIADAGGPESGIPAFTASLRGAVIVRVSVDTMAAGVHAGMFGGAAPDALAALITMLSSLCDEHGNTTIAGLESGGRWAGAAYPADRFRADAGVLDGVDLAGDGEVADLIWARPSVTVLGLDVPPVVGSAVEIQHHARARVSLRIPPGTSAREGHDALVAHLRRRAPWNARVELELEAVGEPFRARAAGPAYEAMAEAMRRVYGTEPVTLGQGGSIPLCTVLQDLYGDAEIMLVGVEEPRCRIHAPNESVDPAEIERLALVEALMLESYGAGGGARS
jgi:cysteinylglycine-S-conjugate dipeptidase